MTIVSIILLLLACVLLPGGLTLASLGKRFPNQQYLLIFSGTYLFSITALDLLPELYSANANALSISLFILAGFFLQLLLEYFSKGAEHGHIHHYGKTTHPYVIWLALSLHAFMEGTVLAGPSTFHTDSVALQSGLSNLLLGIALHKIPAAVVLVIVMRDAGMSLKTQWLLLIFFAVASPLGLGSFYMAGLAGWVDQSHFLYLLALVSGMFLQISTIIFFESRPNRHWDVRKILSGIAGIFLAILIQIIG